MADVVKIINAPNFNDEETPTLKYSVLYSMLNKITSMRAFISLDGTTAISDKRTISQYVDSCPFSLSTNERNKLRSAVTQNSTIRVYYVIECEYPGTVFTTRAAATMTLINHEPLLSPTITMLDGRTLELTGNANSIIANYTPVSFNMGVTTRKGAAVAYRQVVNGSTVKTNISSGNISPVTSNTFYFRAEDSRGLRVEKAITKNLVPYVKLTASLETQPMTANGSLTFTIRGQYYNGSFGAKNNTMELEYAIREVGQDINWTRVGYITPTTSGNTYTYTRTISGLAYNKEYELTVNVIDELTPVQSVSKVVTAIPVFDWGKNDFKHNTDVELATGKAITAYNSDNVNTELLSLTKDDVLRIGYGGIAYSTGETHLLGEDIAIQANGRINLHANQVAFNDNIMKDFVIEEATNGTWHYRKWNSGRVELSGYKNINSEACNTALGGMYRTAVLSSPAFPFTVYNPKTVSSYNSAGYGALIWNTTLETSSKPADFYLIRPTSSAAISGVVNYYTVGTWR